MDRNTLVQRIKERRGMRITSASQDVGSPANATIIAALEEARREVYEDLSRANPEAFETIRTDSYTANAESVALNSAVIGRVITLVECQLASSVAIERYVLRYRNREELATHLAKGDPEYWFLDAAGTKI